jgi:hypothetical protein
MRKRTAARTTAVADRGRQQRRRPSHEARGGSEGGCCRKRAAVTGGRRASKRFEGEAKRLGALSEIKLRWSAREGGEHGLLGSMQIRREKREMWLAVGGMCPDPQIKTHCNWMVRQSIYTNGEATGLAGRIAPLAHSTTNQETPGLAGP